MSREVTLSAGTWVSEPMKLDDLLAIGGRLAILRDKPVSIVATKNAYERFVREWSESRDAGQPTADLHTPTIPNNIYGARLMVEQTISEAIEHAQALIRSGHRVFLVGC